MDKTLLDKALALPPNERMAFAELILAKRGFLRHFKCVTIVRIQVIKKTGELVPYVLNNRHNKRNN